MQKNLCASKMDFLLFWKQAHFLAEMILFQMKSQWLNIWIYSNTQDSWEVNQNLKTEDER